LSGNYLAQITDLTSGEMYVTLTVSSGYVTLTVSSG